MPKKKEKFDLFTKKNLFTLILVAIAIISMSFLALTGYFPLPEPTTTTTSTIPITTTTLPITTTTPIHIIEVADRYCTNGMVALIIRNIGNTDIPANSIEITRITPKPYTLIYCCRKSIKPFQTIDVTQKCIRGVTCVYRLIPTRGASIQVSIYCS